MQAEAEKSDIRVTHPRNEVNNGHTVQSPRVAHGIQTGVSSGPAGPLLGRTLTMVHAVDVAPSLRVQVWLARAPRLPASVR